MFTLGREREKQHAHKYLGTSEDSLLIDAVLDAVHDLLEGGSVTEQTLAAFRVAFIDGGRSTWDQAGSWLVKAGRKFPEVDKLWHEFSRHSAGAVRFRLAAHVTMMSEGTARNILPLLLADRSVKVTQKAAGDMHDCKWPWAFDLLRDRRGIETDVSVVESLDFALDSK